MLFSWTYIQEWRRIFACEGYVIWWTVPGKVVHKDTVWTAVVRCITYGGHPYRLCWCHVPLWVLKLVYCLHSELTNLPLDKWPPFWQITSSDAYFLEWNLLNLKWYFIDMCSFNVNMPAPSHYLDHWWSSLLTHICVTRPQWAKYDIINVMLVNPSYRFSAYSRQQLVNIITADALIHCVVSCSRGNHYTKHVGPCRPRGRISTISDISLWMDIKYTYIIIFVQYNSIYLGWTLPFHASYDMLKLYAWYVATLCINHRIN